MTIRRNVGVISGVWRQERVCYTGDMREETVSKADEEGELQEGEVQIAPEKPKVNEPPRYKVILLNDDYTPMEFVVHVLEIFFGFGREKATQLMLAVHTQGSAVVGIFTRDVAETKSEQVNNYAQSHDHPLLSRVEASD